MSDLGTFLLGAMQITLLDIVLSGDNIGVIALATKDLPEKYAKKASAIGVFAAVSLRIIFACLITYILMIDWLPIKLIGGLLLVKITWNFVRSDSKEENANIHVSSKFMGAICSIIIADITMSLDNVLAIAGAAEGSLVLIVFGLVLNIPIIFFGSQYVAKLMNKHPIVTYIGGAVLAHTSFKMLLEDKLLSPYIPSIIEVTVPYAAALLTIIYGLYIINRPKNYSLRDYKKQNLR
ncbi:TerC family protein [Clostridium magnum]|uniref:Integral membrane protein TerC family protein n=1 Tax=Clostridium magnum DSM 2767 TaxID=1121326 RepID=A0A162SGC1_9CLOT|nr:TerC family protein [Clostridium magnum]KZL91214.1 integral membrane protein TerC family protein [Clostridium magnum DSM 2767]SHI33012.1 integral membrane protein, YjbE family [Clostridium magnum DSM 2767]